MTIDAASVCDTLQRTRSTDGVHYGRAVYDVVAQIVANAARSTDGYQNDDTVKLQ